MTYLGEEILEIHTSEFKEWTPTDFAMDFIEMYGQIDGSHHKTWVLDQVSRILKGSEIIIKKASWDNGNYEYRITTGEPSEQYLQWVKDMKGRYDEKYDEYEYDYDEGVAP